MMQLAKDTNINVYWFYGAPGHGRGLIDAMLSFGCKQPLKRVILGEDRWFPTALSMVEYLKGFFENKGDSTKQHYHVDEAVTASKRRTTKEAFVLKPCRAYHLIAVNSDGEFQKLLYCKGENLNSLFVDATIDARYDVVEDEEEEAAFALDTETVVELVQPSTYVALRTPSTSLESFFLCEVVETDTATEMIEDDKGHIDKGERYAKVYYLQKFDENQKCIKYERPRKQKETLIRISEIFATNILVGPNLKMDRAEYQSIEAAALSFAKL